MHAPYVRVVKVCTAWGMRAYALSMVRACTVPLVRMCTTCGMSGERMHYVSGEVCTVCMCNEGMHCTFGTGMHCMRGEVMHCMSVACTVCTCGMKVCSAVTVCTVCVVR